MITSALAGITLRVLDGLGWVVLAAVPVSAAPGQLAAELNLTGQDSGVYNLEVRSADAVAQRKLVVE
jgi:hypothetical protein